MKDPIDINRCRTAAETLLGLPLVSFEVVGGGNTSQNFLAATESGRWFVKIGRPRRVELTVSRHQAIRSALVPQIASEGRIGSCGERAVCAEEWFEGIQHVDPADMSTEQAEDLVRAYRDFAASAQAVKDAGDGLLYRNFDAGMSPVVIHGDLNFRNVGFRNGRVAAILDLESMCYGYPTEDLLYFVVHEMERTRVWCRRRMRNLERTLGAIIRASGYTKRAWIAAIGIYEEDKRLRRLEKSRFPLFKKIEKWLRAPLYRSLRRIVEKEASAC